MNLYQFKITTIQTAFVNVTAETESEAESLIDYGQCELINTEYSEERKLLEKVTALKNVGQGHEG